MAVNTSFFGSIYSLWLLMAVFLASLGLTTVHSLRLVRGRRLWPRWGDRLCCLVAIFVASVLSVDIFEMSFTRTSNAQHVLLSILAVAAAVAVSVLHLRRSPRGMGGTAFPHIIANVLLLATSGAAAYWTGQRFLYLTQPVSDIGFALNTPGELREVPDLVAVTERGDEVALYRWHVDHDAFEYYASLDNQRYASLLPAVIQRAPPDERANCHGWVFTGGRFLLRGRGVETLLEGNGYLLTDAPCPGDIVIYRDSDGLITHTGLVRGVLAEGTVLVESKWGIGSRYLHRPEDQPYSSDFEYYRRPQLGHDVMIRSRPVAAAGVATPQDFEPSDVGAG